VVCAIVGASLLAPVASGAIVPGAGQGAGNGAAGELLLFTAISLKEVLDDVVAAFADRNPATVVRVHAAASGLLARRRFRGRDLLDAAPNLPLVLLPTVTGYYLIVLLGRRSLIGGPMFEMTGWSITFTWAACVLAAGRLGRRPR
jgi:ABC-type molybdate transport system permease subunit